MISDDRMLNHDERIVHYIEAAEQMLQGQYNIEVPVVPADDELGHLGLALRRLASGLEVRYREIQKINEITMRINSGLLLDEILDGVYEDFREFIPYDRIGFSLLEDEGRIVRARWARSSLPEIHLQRGYAAVMEGSSLQTILETREPRILNDLTAYLEAKPHSNSTRLIVEEGIRSSLTCPLIANGVPVGFLFFSSVEPNTYDHVHVDTFKAIANQLSVIVEKGRLVSELAEQKESIERQNEELQRLNEMKNRFLGMAAHDLRSPIGNIYTASNLMLLPDMDFSPEETHRFLTDIFEQTVYMLGLLDDLLDISQIESGKVNLLKEPVCARTFLEDVIARHNKLASAKNTHVVLDFVAEGEVMADRLRLRQIMDNLLSNASKYSPPGSTIRVRAFNTPSRWRIEVLDEGPGITPEDRARLFQDFARLSAQPTGDEKSTGLGLAITRRVVEAHGGKIGVDSEPGHGATFWFTLPNVG
jgi:signal transduction histidine kinase